MSSAKKDVLKKLANFTGKQMCWSLISGLQLYQKETPTQIFSCEICEIFNNTYFEDYPETTVSVEEKFQTFDIYLILRHI